MRPYPVDNPAQAAKRFRQRDRIKLSVMGVLLLLFSLTYLRQPYPVSSLSLLITQLDPAIETRLNQRTALNQQGTNTAESSEVLSAASIIAAAPTATHSRLVAVGDEPFETQSQAVVGTATPAPSDAAFTVDMAQAEASESQAQALAETHLAKAQGENDQPQTMLAVTLTSPQLIFPADNAELLQGPLTLLGTSEPNTVVQALDYAIVLGTAPVNANGEWAFTFTPSAGLHQFAVRHADEQTIKSNTINVFVADDSNKLDCDGNPGLPHAGHYIVGTCDTLCDISQLVGMTCEALIAANPQISNPNLIFPGQLLTVFQSQ